MLLPLKLMTGIVEIELARVRFEGHPSRKEMLIAHAEDLAALPEAKRGQVFDELEKGANICGSCGASMPRLWPMRSATNMHGQVPKVDECRMFGPCPVEHITKTITLSIKKSPTHCCAMDWGLHLYLGWE